MSKKSASLGNNTLPVEVTNISPHGFWLFWDNQERFLAFKHFPWFRKASIAEIVNVHRFNPNHLYWPDLDIDIEADSIEHPENFPLVDQLNSHQKTL